MNPDDPRLDWLRRYADGQADAATVARIEEALCDDPAFRAWFLDYLNLDGALADFASGAEPATAAPTVPFSARRRIWPLLTAAAAALVFALGLWWWFGPRHARTSSIAIDVIDSDCVPAFATGPQRLTGPLQLDSGSIRFRLVSGALIEAVAPAELCIPEPTRLELHRGNVTTDLSGSRGGFAVETSHVRARVTDRGNRFGVGIADSGDTDIVALEGQVDVFDAPSSAGPLPLASLSEGDAIRIDRFHKPRRLKSVALRRNSLVARPKRKSALVADVADNLADEPGFHRCYAIEPAAMGRDARLHTDKPHVRLLPAEGERLPRELRGADIVRTFYQDHHASELRITIDLARPAVVYILHDARMPPPDWLADSFTPTAIRLRSGPWHHGPAGADSTSFLDYAVWRRECPTPGPLVIGPPCQPGTGSTCATYGIAVQPLGATHPSPLRPKGSKRNEQPSFF